MEELLAQNVMIELEKPLLSMKVFPSMDVVMDKKNPDQKCSMSGK